MKKNLLRKGLVLSISMIFLSLCFIQNIGGTILNSNNPPSIPVIAGPLIGLPNISYKYTFSSTDSENEDISFYIKWGDGKITNWTAYQASGLAYFEDHSWNSSGTFTIEAKAKDINGTESDWGTYKVIMPRNKAINRPFLQFFKNHLYIFQILQLLF